MRVDTEREVAQDLGSQPVAQTHIFESDHPPLSDKFPLKTVELLPGRGPRMRTESRPLPRTPVRNRAFYKIITAPP